MPKQRVKLLFQNYPDRYPHNLERDHARILYNLMQCWGEPEFDPMMQNLLVSTRSDRAGFPPEIVSELMFLSQLHDACLEKGIVLPPLSSTWQQLPPSQTIVAALQGGNLEQVKRYLEAGLPVDYQLDHPGGSPLTVAVSSNKLEVASFLIKSGANVNKRSSHQYTPLHWAALFGHAGLAELLFRNGADLNAQEDQGNTPLMLAVTRNHFNMVYVLLMLGADRRLGNRKGTPLQHAVEMGASDIEDILRRV